MMPKIWPHAVIREMLALADAKGESSAILESARDAELFRFAIYSFRRTTGIGEDMMVTLEDNKVIVTKRASPSVTILQEQET